MSDVALQPPRALVPPRRLGDDGPRVCPTSSRSGGRSWLDVRLLPLPLEVT
jgi:hypothetical protein